MSASVRPRFLEWHQMAMTAWGEVCVPGNGFFSFIVFLSNLAARAGRLGLSKRIEGEWGLI
jgi:hypothetical protein